MGALITADQVGGLVRILLAGVATTAISHGYVDSSTASTIVGGAVGLATAAWSFYTNSPKAMIQSINSADNGVKVVAESATATKVETPLK